MGIKIGNSIVSVDESKVFIEKVEFDKEFVRVVNNGVLEMIINMVNDEFKEKRHSISKRWRSTKLLMRAFTMRR